LINLFALAYELLGGIPNLMMGSHACRTYSTYRFICLAFWTKNIIPCSLL